MNRLLALLALLLIAAPALADSAGSVDAKQARKMIRFQSFEIMQGLHHGWPVVENEWGKLTETTWGANSPWLPMGTKLVKIDCRYSIANQYYDQVFFIEPNLEKVVAIYDRTANEKAKQFGDDPIWLDSRGLAIDAKSYRPLEPSKLQAVAQEQETPAKQLTDEKRAQLAKQIGKQKQHGKDVAAKQKADREARAKAEAARWAKDPRNPDR